jgi:hypothetical protein
MVLGTDAADVATSGDPGFASTEKGAGQKVADPHAKAKRRMMAVLRWSWHFIRPHFRHHKRRDFYESHFIPTWALFVRSLLLVAYDLLAPNYS